MKFGIMFSFVRPPGFEMTEQETYRELKELVPLIEELGYHSFHVTEHHFQSRRACSMRRSPSLPSHRLMPA